MSAGKVLVRQEQKAQWKVTKSTGTIIVGMAVSKHLIGGKDGDQLQNQSPVSRIKYKMLHNLTQFY